MSAAGMPSARTKSSPVPRGRMPSSGSGVRVEERRPFATSCTVPSPPTATTIEAPSSAAWRASSASPPGPVLCATSRSIPKSRAWRSSSGQRLPVAPFADAGLTRKTVCALVTVTGGPGRERQLGHLVDGPLHVLVRDPDELALDDDVADDQQAARPDLAERADREEHGRLHLDGKDAAVRPAAVLARVGVVEDVAGDDRADPHLLAELLRAVHGAVNELPVGRRRVRLAADQ